MKTHRCKDSLKAKVSIRFTLEYDDFNISSDKEAWRLYDYIEDSEYDSIYRHYVTEINYCPFCNEKLK